MAVRRYRVSARRCRGPEGLSAIGTVGVPATATSAARGIRALGSLGPLGDDVASTADALRLLRFPSGVVPHHLASTGRTGTGASRGTAIRAGRVSDWRGFDARI